MKLGTYYLVKNGINVGEAVYSGGVVLSCLLYKQPLCVYKEGLFVVKKKYQLVFIH